MRKQGWSGISLLLLASVGWGCFLQAKGQTWHSQDALPVFRGTDAQAAALRKRGESSACLSHLRSLGLGAWIHASEHNDRLPRTWADFTNELAQADVLFCPADVWHALPVDGAPVDLTAVSYEILAPGALLGGPDAPFLRCTAHSNVFTTTAIAREARPYDARGFPVSSLNLPSPAQHCIHERGVSVRCQSQLRRLIQAAGSFALDHADFLPATFTDIAGMLDGLDTLVCPADSLRAPARHPAELGTSNVTYRLDAPGIGSQVTPKQRFITCPIHDHHADTDGSVGEGTNRYPPRLIVGQPLSWTVEPGRAVELAVATGDPGLGPYRHQWRRLQPFDAAGDAFTNTVEIPDATNRTLRLPQAGPADEGYYDVLVRDAQGGYQLSALACVRVAPLTDLLASGPWEGPACANQLRQIGLAAALFAADHADRWPASGRELIPYLGWPLSWFCPGDTNRTAPGDWEDVDFADSSYALETTLPPGPGDQVLARCRVHGYWVQSDGAVHLGEVAPAVAAHPAAQTTFAGRRVSLTVAAVGDQLRYQWFRNDEAMTGETNSTLSLPGAVVTNTAAFLAVVANSWGSVTSHVATVAVRPITAPRLEATVAGSASPLRLSLTAPAGVACRIESSPGLSAWQPELQTVLGHEPLTFTPSAESPPGIRFYRAVLR